MTANAGTTPQSATVNTAFANALAVTVKDAGNNPVPGVNVTFTAPGSGASGTFSGGIATITVATNASGVAAAPFTANSMAGGPYTVTAAATSLTTVNFSLSNTAGAASSMTANAGTTPQSTAINTAFANALAVTIKDGANNPISGVNVTFTAPGSGPSGTFSNSTATITVATNASGVAAAPFTANSIGGSSYSVSATAAALTTVNFSLTNSYAGPSATFQPVDTTTQGNWPGNYGQDGYIIADDANAAPVYATVGFPGASTYTWVASSADPRALLKSPTTTDRIASTYYATNTFTIDLALTGGPHQVALYLLDLDTSERAETISILDPGNNNAVLDTRSFSGFHNGEYAIWNLQGHVLIQVTCTGGLNAVVSGLFFRTLNPVNPPTVSITSPAPGTVTGPVTITANVQSTAGIQSVQFLLDGANFGAPVTSGQSGNYSISWATPTAANGPHTVAAMPLDTLGQSTTSAAVSVTVSNSTPPPSGSAVFLRTDTSTQGNWKSDYGADGSLIANDSSHLPFYATVGLGNALQWTWMASTSDGRALTKYNSATDRIASAYYNTPSFTLDVNFVDNSPHQVALYLLDWDGGRIETVSILDANNNQVLDTHTVSNFGAGQYLVWNMQGHVLVKVQILNGVSAAISGVFFGAAGATAAPPSVSIISPMPDATLSGTTALSATASSTVGIASVQFVLDNTANIGPAITSGSPYTYQWNTTLGVSNGPHTLTAVATDTLSQQTTSTPVSFTVNNAAPATSAVFAGKDTTTEGTWKTHYGSDGEIIANDSSNPPTYAALNFNGAATWTWATNITDLRALQQAASSNRIASTFYASNSFSLDVNLTDTNTHQLALYFLDWDDSGRAQTVTILDANTQAVLNTQTIANFQNGAYLLWNIKGHVTVQFSRTAGQNAVVSGVFLAPAP
jgi:hypothetical protein